MFLQGLWFVRGTCHFDRLLSVRMTHTSIVLVPRLIKLSYF